ncbi:MAG: glycerol-3-phosphate ABC transporter permease, partial [Geobacillus sp.]
MNTSLSMKSSPSVLIRRKRAIWAMLEGMAYLLPSLILFSIFLFYP